MIFKKLKLYLCSCFVSTVEALPFNFAFGKPTTQSSLFNANHGSNLAVDGNYVPDFNASSCLHTAKETNPWWRVDLQKVVMVSQIFLVRRWFCCFSQLHDFEVRIGNKLSNHGNSNPRCGGLHSLWYSKTKVIRCPSPLIGRYVNIQSIGPSKHLVICEIEVHGLQGTFLNRSTLSIFIASIISR